jgi:hypothetical protein
MWLYMIDTLLTCTLNHVAMNALSSHARPLNTYNYKLQR